MADKYDNGYNSGDFKRNTQQDAGDSHQDQDGEDGVKLNGKAGEYMADLLAEKIRLTHGKFPVSMKLIDQEVVKVQASGRAPGRDNKYLDVYKEKPSKVSVKVLVPLKEHPKFNFVGKLLGPKGNTMKQLQEETMCRMAVLGRGSMRDRAKEEELRNSLDPKYAHLTDELHVEISSIAPPAEAHARIAYALAEVKKYLIPDPPEGPGGMMGWGQPPMDREMMPMAGRAGPHGRPPPRPPVRMPAPPIPRMPPKTKVISILDRARSAMETTYSYEDYGAPEPMRAPPRGQPEEFYYDRAPERFYEDEPYYKDEPPRNDYKQATSREVGTRRPPNGGPQRHHGGGAGGGHNSYARAQPYGGRPQKSGGKPRN